MWIDVALTAVISTLSLIAGGLHVITRRNKAAIIELGENVDNLYEAVREMHNKISTRQEPQNRTMFSPKTSIAQDVVDAVNRLDL